MYTVIMGLTRSTLFPVLKTFFHFIFLKDLNQPSLLSSSVFLITVATKSCPSAEDQLEA